MRFPRLFITRRGYIGLLIVVAWFVVTALLPEVFYYAGFALLGLLFVLMAFDGMQLGWVASPISSSRKMDKILSLGDANRVLVGFKTKPINTSDWVLLMNYPIH